MDTFLKSLASATLATCLAGTAFASTNPPPQLQSYVLKTSNDFPQGFSLDTTYRIANNGSSQINRLLCGFRATSNPDTAPYFDRDAQQPLTLLSQAANTTVASARCGNYAGYIGGEMNLDDTTPATPTWWLSTGSYNRLTNGSRSGLFWDVSEYDSQASDCYFVGYFFDGSNKTTIRYRVSNLTRMDLDDGSYSGAEARGPDCDRVKS